MKVHPDLKDKEDVILENAKKVGLDKLDFEERYSIKKTSTKNSGYAPDYSGIFGSILLIGNDDFVSLYVHNFGEWFRTSPVVSVTKKNKNEFTIETENSFYSLKSGRK